MKLLLDENVSDRIVQQIAGLFPEKHDMNVELATLTTSIKLGSKVELFEGLPHQTWENELLAYELKSKKTVRVHGYHFYESPLNLTPKDTETLRSILADSGTYRAFSGEKRCGGFHPDYCVSWVYDSRTYCVHICFGCEEFKSFGMDCELRTDAEKIALRKDHFNLGGHIAYIGRSGKGLIGPAQPQRNSNGGTYNFTIVSVRRTLKACAEERVVDTAPFSSACFCRRHHLSSRLSGVNVLSNTEWRFYTDAHK